MIRLIFLLITVNAVLSSKGGYYWRDYLGEIPEDAIIAGQDMTNKNIYIGQAFVNGEGLIVSEIFGGKREVEAPYYGVKTVKSYIKILCGNQVDFEWQYVTASDLNNHGKFKCKTPVIGGHEGGGILYIGRIHHQGTTKIGKVNSFVKEDAKLYFVSNGKQKISRSYQVLLYNK